MAEVKTEFHPFRSIKQSVWMLLAGVVLAGICFGVGFFTGGRQQESVPQLSTVMVEHQLQRISQLATTRYAYTNMGQFSQSNDFYGFKIPFTTKRFIVSYDGVIMAGMDMSQTKVEVSRDAVSVTLPPAQILSHEIDPESLEVFDETKNIFNPITIQDYNGFHADQRGIMEAKALESGLLEQAEDQAKLVVGSLLQPMLGEGQTLTIEVMKAE